MRNFLAIAIAFGTTAPLPLRLDLLFPLGEQLLESDRIGSADADR